MSGTKPLLLAIMLVGFIGAPLAAPAQTVNCAKPKMLSIADLGECANRKLAAAESELDKTFKKALAQYTPKAAQATDTTRVPNSIDGREIEWERRIRDDLKASQIAWLRYRESACGSVSDWYDGGTAAEINVPECKTELTRARIKFLRTYFLSR